MAKTLKQRRRVMTPTQRKVDEMYRDALSLTRKLKNLRDKVVFLDLDSAEVQALRELGFKAIPD